MLKTGELGWGVGRRKKSKVEKHTESKAKSCQAKESDRAYKNRVLQQCIKKLAIHQHNFSVRFNNRPFNTDNR